MVDSSLGAGGFTANEDKLISNEFNLFSRIKYYKDVSRIFPIIMRPQSSAAGNQGVPYTFEAPFDLVNLIFILIHKLCFLI